MAGLDPSDVIYEGTVSDLFPNYNDSDNGFTLTDVTSDLDNDQLNNQVSRIWKNPERFLKFVFDRGGFPSVNDTIGIYSMMWNAGVSIGIYAYDSTSTITTTGALLPTPPTGSYQGWFDWTINQAFIDELYDWGGGKWACRLTVPGETDALRLSEARATLTAPGPEIGAIVKPSMNVLLRR